MDEKDRNFEKAVNILLELEGGYVNDPADPGGETNYGISRRSYPDLDIGALTEDEAIEIYRRDWWERYGYGRIEDSDLAAKILSLAVNMGPSKAHRLLQAAVLLSGGRMIMVDGIIGPETVGAVNGHPNPAWLLAELRLMAIKHYVELDNPRYLKGWIRRALA